MSSLSMKKTFAILLSLFLICQTAYASPWAEKESYGGKVLGKFLFGLKNATLGWTEIFTEPQEYKFKLQRSEWEGFCNGMAKAVFYTANGLIHLATFPIPVDFPNMGEGTLPSLGKKGPPKPWEKDRIKEEADAAQAAAIEAAAIAQPITTAPPAQKPAPAVSVPVAAVAKTTSQVEKQTPAAKTSAVPVVAPLATVPKSATTSAKTTARTSANVSPKRTTALIKSKKPTSVAPSSLAASSKTSSAAYIKK